MTVPLLPETAPFTPAQRAWLNGFFAGLLGLDAGSNGNGHVNGVAAAATLTTAVPAVEEDLPWHDPALVLDERLKLAEGRPYERKLMACMAQLDCGACGYLCQSYAEAIACGEEKDLTRCSPGGKDTARKLKELVAIGPSTTSSGTMTSVVSSNGNGIGHGRPTITTPEKTASPSWATRSSAASAPCWRVVCWKRSLQV